MIIFCPIHLSAFGLSLLERLASLLEEQELKVVL
jgi:hypothetical protein